MNGSISKQMNTSDNKEILMRILGIDEFGYRNMVHLMLWPLWLYGLCQKRLAQKQPPRGVPRKRCSESVQQIYRRTPMPK